MKLQRSILTGTAALFSLVLVFGGGGAPAPIMQALLEAVGLAWLLFLVWAHCWGAPASRPSAFGILFIAALPALALAQLVPLPYDLWTSLPGRATAARAVDLAGLGEIPRPLSLNPEATRATIISIIPAIAIFVGVSSIRPQERVLLAKILVGAATLSAFVASLQVATAGNPSLYLFPKSVIGAASGLFANRNFQSDLLLLAIVVCSAQIRGEEGHLRVRLGGVPRKIHLGLLLIPFLALMVLATGSRSGAALLGPVLLLCFAAGSKWRLIRTVPIGLAAIALFSAILIAVAPPFVTALAGRYGLLQDLRFDALPDLRYAVETYFPVGSGLGTFDPIFRSAESLSIVGPTYFNHAHDDYIEIAIETGLFGLALVALFIIAYLFRTWQLLRRPKAETAHAWLQRASVLGIALLLLHSVLDYPLRTIALQCTFAFMCAVLFSDGQDTPPIRRKRRRETRGR